MQSNNANNLVSLSKFLVNVISVNIDAEIHPLCFDSNHITLLNFAVNGLIQWHVLSLVIWILKLKKGSRSKSYDVIIL